MHFLKFLGVSPYGVDGLDFGDWYAPGVTEGTQMMLDNTVNVVSAVQRKVGNTTVLDNSTYRWFAQGYNVYGAWIFSGTYGNLAGTNVHISARCQAVALLEID